MGLFSSKDHLFNYLEEVVVDRNFLNLHNYIKKYEFDQRSKLEAHRPHQIGEHLSYDFFINKRRVRFHCSKITFKNHSLYSDYYYDAGAQSQKDDSYIGLPNLYTMEEYGVYPFRILELDSMVLIKEKFQGRKRERFVNASKKYHLQIKYQSNGSWKDKLVEDFNYIANKIIKETLQYLGKLKRNQ